MKEPGLEAMRDVIQEDVGNRGLRTDPAANLLTVCQDDFVRACHHIAETPNPAVAVVTGFYIAHAQPPCGETDGPLGAVFLARALVPLGIRVVLVTDAFCTEAIRVGLSECGLEQEVRLITLPDAERAGRLGPRGNWQEFIANAGPLTHLIALERVGPSHTRESLESQAGTDASVIERFLGDVPADQRDRCYSMKGRDITSFMSPAHWHVEAAAAQVPRITTIGIGDGGNEIGMGKMPWDVIRRNIPRGGLVACRVPTDFLLVCGVSNWGAYGLAAGVRRLRGLAPDTELFSSDHEYALLRCMVERGPLVDGVLGRPTISVDGLSFERYAEALSRLRTIH